MCAMSNPLEHKTVTSPRGTTHYWIAKHDDPAAPVLVFLPGLSADHRLFDEQTAHFAPHCTVLVWDAPAHGLSRPYQDFSYRNLAGELLRILDAEALPRVVLVGQSAGGFVAQSLIATARSASPGCSPSAPARMTPSTTAGPTCSGCGRPGGCSGYSRKRRCAAPWPTPAP